MKTHILYNKKTYEQDFWQFKADLAEKAWLHLMKSGESCIYLAYDDKKPYVVLHKQNEVNDKGLTMSVKLTCAMTKEQMLGAIGQVIGRIPLIVESES